MEFFCKAFKSNITRWDNKFIYLIHKTAEDKQIRLWDYGFLMRPLIPY